MICPNCGMKLPEDSEFCQYCGSKLSLPDENTLSVEETIVQQTIVEPSTTPMAEVLESDNTQDRSNETSETPQDSKRSSNKWKKAAIGLSVLLLFLAGLNAYQYMSSQENKNKVHELSGTITELNSQIENLNTQIDDLNSTISKKTTQIKDKDSEIASINSKKFFAEQDAEKYKSIVQAVKQGNLGYAASNFHSSESIIVVGENEKNRKFTLTANWSNGGTVSIDYDSLRPSAYVDFDQDEWSTSTKMSVTPSKAGVTVVTFSNDVNRQSFNMIIIVE